MKKTSSCFLWRNWFGHRKSLERDLRLTFAILLVAQESNKHEPLIIGDKNEK